MTPMPAHKVEVLPGKSMATHLLLFWHHVHEWCSAHAEHDTCSAHEMVGHELVLL